MPKAAELLLRRLDGRLIVGGLHLDHSLACLPVPAEVAGIVRTEFGIG
jgi:hypothetical protein